MNTLNDIEIPGLIWSDEFDWTGVVSEVSPAVNGNLVVQEAAVTSGRPVTLKGGADFGWLKRSALLALQALAAVPEATYTLSYNGTDYTVRWRHEDGQVIEATPVIDYEDAEPGDDYHQITLKLITV
jgi:hypothetical protein